MFVVVIVIAAVLWLVARLRIIQIAQEFWSRFRFAHTLPGPAFTEIIGNATEERTLSWITELSEKHGSLFRVWFAEKLKVMVSDPDHVKTILSSNTLLDKSSLYETMRPWLGNGLITNGGAAWQHNAFETPHTSVPLQHPGLIWKQIPILFYLSPSGQKFRASLKVLNDHTKRVIRIRRSEITSSIDPSQPNEFGIKRRCALLDSLLQALQSGAELTDKDVQPFSELINRYIILKGHDTTSSAISFAIHALSQYPDFQKRLRDEVENTFDLDSTPFLDRFIKETLRLYPSVPYYTCLAVEPFKLGDHIIIPKGTSIMVLAYRLHLDPNLFPDPTTFNPDRYRDEDSVQPFSHVAFSAGPRNCIGQRLALLELKCTLSKLVRAFDIVPVEGRPLDLTARLILGSLGGIPVRLSERAN